MESVVVYENYGRPDVFNFGEDIERAKQYFKESYQTCLKHARTRPDRKYWVQQCKNYLQAEKSIFVTTFDNFLEIQKKAYCTPPVEITEELYDEMLEVLPPLKWEFDGKNNWFCLSEMTTGTLTSQYARINGKYYTATVDITDRNTWIINTLNK